MSSRTPGMPLREATKYDLPGTIQNGRNCRHGVACCKRGGRPIPTVIIHHNALLRAGLAHILAETQFRVRTQCSSFNHLQQRAWAGEQCLALIGIDHSNTGLVLSEIPHLKNHGAHVYIVVLGEQLRSPELLSFIEAGADGYLLTREITPESLLSCLEMVRLGGVVIPRGSISIRETEAVFRSDSSDLIESASPSASVSTSMQGPAQSAEFPWLSNREREILSGLMQGASNKHIARSLDIAEATVKVHVKSVLRKLRVTNRTQAAMWATNRFSENADVKVSSQKNLPRRITLEHAAVFDTPALPLRWA